MAKPPGRKSSLSVSLPPTPRFVSRGGEKLQGALEVFGVSVQGKICLDVGASTGGFTDCLLQAGARSVWAVDVGWGQLDFKLRNDPRVHVLERVNFRHLDPVALTDPPQVVVVDVAFISLGKIFPKILEMLEPGGKVLALAKPQFEGTPREAPGGFVRSEAIRQDILARVRALAERAGFNVLGSADSTLRGRQGNRETFLYLGKPS